MGNDIVRVPRKHGAKAEKYGISSEYVCICTNIQRKGNSYAATINRVKPDSEELKALFEGHIADGTLILCYGLRSYSILPTIANCTVNYDNDLAGEFYNLNMVNGFHSFIKRRYNFYRNVATKYLNRYNALFASTYRNVDNLIKKLKDILLLAGKSNYSIATRM